MHREGIHDRQRIPGLDRTPRLVGWQRELYLRLVNLALPPVPRGLFTTVQTTQNARIRRVSFAVVAMLRTWGRSCRGRGRFATV